MTLAPHLVKPKAKGYLPDYSNKGKLAKTQKAKVLVHISKNEPLPSFTKLKKDYYPNQTIKLSHRDINYLLSLGLVRLYHFKMRRS